MTAERLAERNRKVLVGLDPVFAEKASGWYAEMQETVVLLLVEGTRTMERQAELFSQGRDREGNVVGKIATKARPGQSFHNYGRAFDWVPCVKQEPGNWIPNWEDEKAYAYGAALAGKHGLRPISWETGHLEDAAFATWRELSAECRPMTEPARPARSTADVPPFAEGSAG